MPNSQRISFSPPDITDDEIAEVIDALRSGWITTGPKTKQLERDLAAFTDNSKVACLSSATAALECALRALGIGPGDEVITSAYTYTASASPICHVGATPILCDTAPGSYEMDYDMLADLVTERTRAIIPVDIAGRMCDYDRLEAALENVTDRWHPTTDRQRACGRIPIVADAAHALGATRKDERCGSVADLTTFSFHAVKNLTTAEGGALTWRKNLFDSEKLYQEIMLMSLHGQTKDALSKANANAWEYDIAFPGWKCNMTDIQAAIGLAQLRRYPELLKRRRQLIERYETLLANASGAGRGCTTLQHYGSDFASSGHLMLVQITGATRAFRDALIERMAAAGAPANVHYKPLPLLSAYRNLGFHVEDFPCATSTFESEITLPLHTLLTDDDVDRIVQTFKSCCTQLISEGAC